MSEQSGTEQSSKLIKRLLPAARRPSIESGLRYRSDDWLINFLSIPNSFILQRIRFHLISNTLIGLLVVALNRLFPKKIGMPLSAHSILGGFMSLLLVFRTNSAYSRFGEGRSMWSKCLSTSRNMALATSAHVLPHSPRSAKRLLELLAAFPDALVYSCLCRSAPLSESVKEVLGEGCEDSSLEPATALCFQMHKAVHGAADESPTSSSDFVEAMHLVEVSHDINYLIDIMTTCRKIARTPVPMSYSRHTSRFLTIWCGTLPFALVPQLGMLTLPVVTVACWCLFGIEEIGHMLEQPFVGDVVTENNVEGLAPVKRRSAKTQPWDIGVPVTSLAYRARREVLEIAALAGI